MSTTSTASHRGGEEAKEALCEEGEGRGAHPGFASPNNGMAAHPGGHAGGHRHIEDDCLICCEILDSRTRSTLYHNPTVAHEAEYVLSHMTVSKVISMVAMKREVRGVLEELLAEEGQSFFVMPITRYLDPATAERHMSFWELSVRVKQSGDLLIGYQRAEEDHVMEINPTDKQKKITWREGDFVVVVCDICRVFRAGVTPHTGKRRKARPPGSLTPGSAKSTGGKRFSFGAVASGSGVEAGGAAAGWTQLADGGGGQHQHQHQEEELFSPASTLQTLQSPELDRGLQLGSLGHTPSGRAPTFPGTPLALSVNPADSLSLSANGALTLPELVVGPGALRTQNTLTTVQAFQQEVDGGPLSPSPGDGDEQSEEV